MDKAQHTLMLYYIGLGVVCDGTKESHFSACTNVRAHAQENVLLLFVLSRWYNCLRHGKIQDSDTMEG